METTKSLVAPTVYTEKKEEISGIEIYKDILGNCYLKHKDGEKFIDPKYHGGNMKDVQGSQYHGNPSILYCRFLDEEGKDIYGVYLLEKRKWLKDLFLKVLTDDDKNHLAGKLIIGGSWSVYNIHTEEKVKIKFQVETDRFDNVEICGHKLSVSFNKNFSEIIRS